MNVKIGTRTISTLQPLNKPYEVRDTELIGLLIRVQPSGVMVYYCEYRNDLRLRNRVRIGRVTSLTTAQARDKAKKILGDVASGKDPAREKKREKAILLEAFIDNEYKPWALQNLKRGAETISRLKRRFSTLLNERLDDLSDRKLEKWITERKSAGINNATINRNIGMLKAALSKAVEWKILDRHPLISLKKQKTDQSIKIRNLNNHEELKLYDALDIREERLRLDRATANQWRVARSHKPFSDLYEKPYADYLKPMVILSLNTGIRQGELFSLEWSNIDFERNLLSVLGSQSKNGQTRHIPLNTTVFTLLNNWKLCTGTTSGLVFPNKSGIKFNNIKRSWTSVLKLAEIRHFRWHDLRHTFASNLVMAGVDLNIVRELLGHSNLRTTLKYAHLSPQIKAEAVNKLIKTTLSTFLTSP